MMTCAMAEHADTFSTTLALKVLRLQMEQTEAQLQSTVNESKFARNPRSLLVMVASVLNAFCRCL